MPVIVHYSSEKLIILGLKDSTPRCINRRTKVDVVCKCGVAGLVTMNSVLLTFDRSARGWSCRQCQSKLSAATQKGTRIGADNHFFGKHHSAETKDLISSANSDAWEQKTDSYKKEVGQRLRVGFIEKFGVNAPVDVATIRQRQAESNQKHWDENHDTRINKVKETNISKYGHEWAAQSEETQNKTVNTNLERFGVERPAQSDVIKNKMAATFQERFGGNPMCDDEVRLKHIQSMANRPSTSADENEIADFIRSLGHEVVKTYIGGNDPKEIDIHAIGTKFFLEFNGCFYHSDYFPKITPSYHLRKTQQCQKQFGAHLIHIFDHEWKLKRDQVKSFLKAKLSNDFQKLRASKGEIREIARIEANAFLDKIHLQGGTHRSFLHLGLYFGDQLTSVMSFSQPHRQNMDRRPHLARFATLPGIKVHGGLSKLSQHAHTIIGEFVTFIHYRLSDGAAYVNAGYAIDKMIRPDYFYYNIKTSAVVSKQSRKGKNIGGTEAAISRAEGLYKVHDCGKIKMVFAGG